MKHLEIEQNIYSIDHQDNLVFTNSVWDDFADSNEAPELSGTDITGRSLWDFVSGDMIRHIYQQILVLVRAGESVHFDFRCDSPDRRRFLQMNITPEPNGVVRFATLINRVEERSTQEIFRRSSTVSEDIVITCSWCKKIKTGDDTWSEVEQAIIILDLFELDPAPQLSHGMCSNCYDITLRQIENRRINVDSQTGPEILFS